MSNKNWKPVLELSTPNTNFKEKNIPLKIYTRGATITSNLLNSIVKIHNGIRFFDLTINEKMIGYKFGEFSPTRKFPQHKKKKTQLKKK